MEQNTPEETPGERQRLLEAVAAQAVRQAALLRLSADLGAVLEESEVCRRVVDGLHDTLGYDFVALFLVDPATGDRVHAASAGAIEPPARIAPEQGLSERPLLDGQLHYTPDVSQHSDYIYWMGGSEVDVPIRIGGTVQGVLIAESRQRGAFDQEDFEVLTAATQQAGLAIGNARLLAAERARADELDALRTTMAEITAELELSTLLQAIVKRAAGLVDASGGELGLYDAASQEVRIVVSYNLGPGFVGTCHKAGEGAMGRVAESGEPLIIADYDTWDQRAPQYAELEIHAVLASPLKVGNRLVGIITLVTTDPGQQFDAADLHLLTLFGQQAAIAVENAQLYDQAQQEIAERLRAEEELRQYQEQLEERVAERTAELQASEERYRSLFDGVPVGLYRTTPSGRLLDANLALAQIEGYPDRDTLLATDIASMYVSPEDRVRWQALMEQEGTVRDFENQIRKHDGTVIWVNDSARAVTDNQGAVLYYEGSIEDITERKLAEDELREYREHLEELVTERTAELRESEARYRTLFDGVPVGLYQTTPTGDLLEGNLAAAQMFGFPSREDYLTIPVSDYYVDPEDRVRWQRLMEREGVVRGFEAQLYRYDGTVMWVSDTARTVTDEQGQVLYYEGSLEDITQRKEFEEEIRRQKDYLEALFDNSPVAVVTADLEGKVVSWNPMAETLFGYAQEEAIGSSLEELVAGDDSIRKEAADYTDRVLSEMGRVQATTKRTRKDGSLVDVELLALSLVLAGKKVGFCAIYHDITELKATERELRQQKDYFEALFVNSPVAVVTGDLEAKVSAWNPMAEKLFGYTQEEAVGRDLDELVAADDSIREEAVGYTNLVRQQGRVQATAKRTRKDGSLVDVELLALPLVLAGEEVGFYAMYHDISGRKAIERELRHQKEYYEALFVNSPVAVVTVDWEGKVISWNPEAEQLFGYLPAEAIGQDIDDLVARDDSIRAEAVGYTEAFRVHGHTGAVKAFPDLVDRQGRLQVATKRTRKDGSLVEVELLGLPVMVGGEEIAFIAIYHDISELKAIERELRNQKEYYEALFVNSPVAVVTVDRDGNVLSWNPTAERLFGYTQDEAIGQNVDDLIARDDSIRAEAVGYTEVFRGDGYLGALEAYPNLMDEQGRLQVTTKRTRKDGSMVEVELSGLPVIVAGEEIAVIAIYHDISELKAIERELRRQKEYYEALFVNSPAAVVTVDRDGAVVSWNPAAEQLFGYMPAEAIGQDIDDLVARDDSIRAEAVGYTEAFRANGHAGAVKAFPDRVDNLGRLQVTTKRTRKDGSIVEVEWLGLPVMVGGEEVAFIAIYHDIGPLQEARREAEAANRAKSTFLANMSHELRTPLNAILGFAQLMDGAPNLSGEQRENLRIINRSGEHLLALINDVLEMSKIEAGQLTVRERCFDLHGLLDGLEEMFRLRAEEKGLTLSFRRADDVPRLVMADEGKLRQVLSNLLGNAVKFTQEGGVALRVVAHPGERKTKLLCFEVEDTGPGIAPEELGMVFEPFVQAAGGRDVVSTQLQEGTGLGLSISRQFARLMGGDISVSSELGQGSLFRFDVEVELTDQAEAEAVRPRRRVYELAPGQTAPDGGSYRLLVVEDREANRQLLVRLLADIDHASRILEVREARNGLEALELWEDWDPHLIWMDMRMPVMDGREATQRIKAVPQGQDTVIIALTATAFEEDREAILLEGCNDFVRKPFRKEVIYDMLHKHLGVCFIYEDGEEEPGASDAAALSVENLAAQPADWLAELRAATIRADQGRMLALAEQIREQDAALAHALEELIRGYEYKRILTVLENAGGVA